MRAILLGFGCNNACVFCAQGRLRETEDVTPALDVAPGETIALLGGEPTLADDLPETIASLVDRGAERITLQTNGRRLAYASFARALADAGRGRLFLDVSLAGPTREIHDFHTSVEGSFAQTITGLRNARAASLPVGVTCVYTRSSYRHLVDVARVAHAVGARALWLRPVEPLGTAARNPSRLVAPKELAAPHVAAALREARRLGLDDPRAYPFAGIGVTAG